MSYGSGPNTRHVNVSMGVLIPVVLNIGFTTRVILCATSILSGFLHASTNAKTQACPILGRINVLCSAVMEITDAAAATLPSCLACSPQGHPYRQSKKRVQRGYQEVSSFLDRVCRLSSGT